MASVRVRPVRNGTDREFLLALLKSCDLPTADLEDVRLFVCEADGDRVGGGGLEYHGEVALLRSVAVKPAFRGEGYGSAIVEALGERAREEGAEGAYLLTTTAADFFRGLGFEAVERDAVPGAVRATAQFQGLCPASATCMERSLG